MTASWHRPACEAQAHCEAQLTFKDDIAELVRSVPRAFPVGTGDCLDRSLVGAAVLTALGLPATLKLGALLYRVGPDPVRDCITICAPDRHNLENHFCVGHFYLRSGPDLIDFSVGDFRADAAVGAPSMQWSIVPPDFFWDDAAHFARDPAQEVPEIGRAWYHSVIDDLAHAFVEKMVARKLAALRADPNLRAQLVEVFARFNLRERVKVL
jgi:Transglutaminase-like superfamily